MVLNYMKPINNLFLRASKLPSIVCVLTLLASCSAVKSDFQEAKTSFSDLLVFQKTETKPSKRKVPIGNRKYLAISSQGEQKAHRISPDREEKPTLTENFKSIFKSKKTAQLPVKKTNKATDKPRLKTRTTAERTYPKLEAIPAKPKLFNNPNKIKQNMVQDIESLRQEIHSTPNYKPIAPEIRSAPLQTVPKPQPKSSISNLNKDNSLNKKVAQLSFKKNIPEAFSSEKTFTTTEAVKITIPSHATPPRAIHTTEDKNLKQPSGITITSTPTGTIISSQAPLHAEKNVKHLIETTEMVKPGELTSITSAQKSNTINGNNIKVVPPLVTSEPKALPITVYEPVSETIEFLPKPRYRHNDNSVDLPNNLLEFEDNN
jgi:hypothetical protein